MDFEQSDQFTQRVELIIRNFLNIPEQANHNWKEINQKIDQLQNQLMETFEAIREQLQCDLEVIQIQTQSKNLQQVPLPKTDERVINEGIDQIKQNIQDLEKSLINKIDILNIKVETIRDNLSEQIKSFDARMESQWQGLANVSDQFWLLKKQIEPIFIGTSQQKKNKHSLFM